MDIDSVAFEYALGKYMEDNYFDISPDGIAKIRGHYILDKHNTSSNLSSETELR